MSALGSDCCQHLTRKENGAVIAKKNTSKRASGKQTARTPDSHPDHSIQLKKLNRVLGQIEGIKRMVQNRRYCPDILLQTRAAASALKSIEMAILETHLRHCVSEALTSRDIHQATTKMEEIMKVMSRF